MVLAAILNAASKHIWHMFFYCFCSFYSIDSHKILSYLVFEKGFLEQVMFATISSHQIAINTHFKKNSGLCVMLYLISKSCANEARKKTSFDMRMESVLC